MLSSRGNVFWTPRVIFVTGGYAGWMPMVLQEAQGGGGGFWMYIHIDLCDSGDLFRLSHSGVGQNKTHSNKSE